MDILDAAGGYFRRLASACVALSTLGFEPSMAGGKLLRVHNFGVAMFLNGMALA